MTSGQGRLHGNKLTAHLLEQKPDIADFGRPRTYYFYDILDKALQGRDFVAADRYTAAECVALPTLDFASQLVGVPYTEDHTNIKAWHERMQARDSAGA